MTFGVVAAENLEQAIERAGAKAGNRGWDAAVAAIEMATLLRRLPQGDRPRVVFCTTENDVAHIARALHAGANEYIMKPFDREIVEAKFQEVGLI